MNATMKSSTYKEPKEKSVMESTPLSIQNSGSSLNAYADRQKVFESILLNKLEGFFSDLGWSLDLNPHINALSSFEI